MAVLGFRSLVLVIKFKIHKTAIPFSLQLTFVKQLAITLYVTGFCKLEQIVTCTSLTPFTIPVMQHVTTLMQYPYTANWSAFLKEFLLIL